MTGACSKVMDKVKTVVQDPEEVEATTRKFGGEESCSQWDHSFD